LKPCPYKGKFAKEGGANREGWRRFCYGWAEAESSGAAKAVEKPLRENQPQVFAGA